MNYHHSEAVSPPRVPPRRGCDGGVAVPRRDGAGRAAARAVAAATDKTRLICIEEVHGLAGCNNWGAIEVPVRARDDRPRLHARARQPVQHARGVPRHMTIVSNTDVRNAEAFAAAGNRRRPLPLERGVPDPVASEADAGLGPLRRHLARSALRASAPGRPRRCRRCSSASRTSTRPAAAPTTTRAPTPTRSAGRRRASRCR